MDAVAEIKAKLPIEELVAQYCTLQKKGKTFMCTCPFHNDSHPSFQVSPEKGIAYCFVCQTGGDIFSFYQAIEGVDFRQALKDLAEKTGVKVETTTPAAGAKKDDKDRARACLEDALRFYSSSLSASDAAKSYIQSRGISEADREKFKIGFAPDSFSDTYQHLLKKGHSKQDIVNASLAIQKDLADGKMYDRFRNRVMFPIFDHKGSIVAFGGRTIGNDDAKYINSSETALYNKSHTLFGLHLAKDAMRKTKSVILVEGYTDVIACHRLGIENVVAVSGTALTEEHVKLLKRYVERVILCLDADQAGRQAAERAFELCTKEDIRVHVVRLSAKDPDEMSKAQPEHLTELLQKEGVPYLDAVVEELSERDVRSATGKHEALQMILPLLNIISSSVERSHYMSRVAALLGTTETALKDDVARIASAPTMPAKAKAEPEKKEGFSSIEVVLGLLLLHKESRDLLERVIEPDPGFALQLYEAMKGAPKDAVKAGELALPEAEKERVNILLLYCEHHGFASWASSLARSEITKSIIQANRDCLKKRQKEISKKILLAQKEGKTSEAATLMNKYNEVLKLAKIASL